MCRSIVMQCKVPAMNMCHQVCNCGYGRPPGQGSPVLCLADREEGSPGEAFGLVRTNDAGRNRVPDELGQARSVKGRRRYARHLPYPTYPAFGPTWQVLEPRTVVVVQEPAHHRNCKHEQSCLHHVLLNVKDVNPTRDKKEATRERNSLRTCLTSPF